MLDTILPESFNTYSLIAPGFSFDESEYIRDVGRNTKVQQFFTQLSEEDFLREFHDFVKTQEEPVTGMSPYAQYRVMKLAHYHKSKVLLDGQGGDEIFAGYNYYFSYYFYELLKKGKLITLLNEMILYNKNFNDYYPHRMLAFMLLPESFKNYFWKAFIAESWINLEYLNRTSKGKTDPRWQRLNLLEGLSLTLYSTAIPHLLRWEDKNSMRWSIESRPPFLDVNLVESAMYLPSGKKIADGRTKVIFKEAVRDILPPMIRERKNKIGFAPPVDDFFRKEEIIRFCKDIMYSESFKNRPYWKWNEVERHYVNHLKGKFNIGDNIWKWINLEIWLREFFPLNQSE
jgi:asparagine synthase (glutamine-hydrolysing)